MKILGCYLFSLLLIIQCIVNIITAAPQNISPNDAEARLLRLKKRKLCKLLGLSPRNIPEAEARTLVFLQVQQIQGSPYPAAAPYPGGGNGCNSILGGGGGGGGHLGGGGGLLGGLVGGLLGSPQSGLLGNVVMSPPSFGDLSDVRPQRYIRPINRVFNSFLDFFKK